METESLLDNELSIDPESFSHLKESAVWAKVLGVVGFIMSGLILIFGIFSAKFYADIAVKARGAYNGDIASIVGGTVFIIFLLFAVIGFFISLFNFRFATKLSVALKTADQDSLIQSFKNLKLYFRLLGIIMIIYLFFMIISVIVMAVAINTTSRY